jgi:hypothetical protein
MSAKLKRTITKALDAMVASYEPIATSYRR